MGKASSSKKVARAATTGGGRTAGGRRPWLYYAALTLAVVLGVSLVVQSRHERQVQLAAGTVVAPRMASGTRPFDHWHMAYGFYICGTFAPDLPDDSTKGGIHTHADGLIHVEPLTVDDSGDHATVGRFVKLAGVTLSATEIKLPGQDAYTNGKKCPDGKPGEVETYVNGTLRAGDPKTIKLTDGGKVVFAFVSKGTKVPDPPSLPNLQDPNAGEGSTINPNDITTATAPPTTAAPAGTTATTAAPTATTATTAKK